MNTNNFLLPKEYPICLLYTSDAADEEDSVDLGGRRIIKTRENRGKELYNARMHFSLICCQKCERQCSNNDLLPA